MEPQQKNIRRAVLKGAVRLADLLALAGTISKGYLHYKLALDEHYRPRPDDVFVVTFPKSGTTLMQMMLYQLSTEGEMDFPHIDSVSPWFELHLSGGLGEHVEAAPSPRIFKSHLRYHDLPQGVRSIYLARHPGDVAVSAYHHHRLVSGRDADLDRYVDDFFAGRTRFGSWCKHIESWWPHRNDPNVLFLRYEEVIADLPETARRVAAFCGLPLDDAKLARVVERCSLPFMKRYDAKFDPRLHQVSRGRREFIRKGVPGQGRRALSTAQEEQLARRLAALAGRLRCAPGELSPPARQEG